MKTKTNQLNLACLSGRKPASSLQQEPMNRLTAASTRPGRLSVAFAVAMLAAFFSLQVRIACADPNPPPGFASTLLSADLALPSSLAFGPDGQLYVCGLGADALDGTVWVINPVSGATHVFGKVDAPDPEPLGDYPVGILVGRDGTVFVSDSSFDRTSGLLVGRVRALRDTDHDGVADVNEVVLDGIPNGRHDNNGMAFGPDGFIYLTIGSRTDDGINGSFCLFGDCPGEDPVYSGTIVRFDPARRNQRPSDTFIVAKGMRNIFDLAFWPKDPRYIYIPMNGSDVPAADDLLFRARVNDSKVDDMGWPSCLYNIEPREGYPLIPQPNPVPGISELFGPCDAKEQKHLNRPLLTFGKHVSADGLAFAPKNFARGYGGDLFVAEFGQSDPVSGPGGHQIVRIKIGDDGLPKTGRDRNPVVEHFAFGAPTDTPTDLVFGPDGAMYVVDIFNNSVFRIARIRSSEHESSND